MTKDTTLQPSPPHEVVINTVLAFSNLTKFVLPCSPIDLLQYIRPHPPHSKSSSLLMHLQSYDYPPTVRPYQEAVKVSSGSVPLDGTTKACHNSSRSLLDGNFAATSSHLQVERIKEYGKLLIEICEFVYIQLS